MLLRRFPNHGRRERAVTSMMAGFTGVATNAGEYVRLYDESLAIFRELDDRWGIAEALVGLAWGNQGQYHDLALVKQNLLSNLNTYREIGDDFGAALVLLYLATFQHHLGEYAQARRCFEEALTLMRKMGDLYRQSNCLDEAGYTARQMGDFGAARQMHEESLALSREIGDQQGVAGSLDNLGLVALDAGDFDQAERLFREGLEIRRHTDVAWTWLIAVSTLNLSAVMLAKGNLSEAERYARESVSQSPEWSECLNQMGHVLRAHRKAGEAQSSYRAALASALHQHILWSALHSVFGLAALRADAGDTAGAAEGLTFVAHHQATDYATRMTAEALLAELRPKLSPTEWHEAQRRAAALTLEAFQPEDTIAA
jgi:tetratricopeptide (TPR) repeat protein